LIENAEDRIFVPASARFYARTAEDTSMLPCKKTDNVNGSVVYDAARRAVLPMGTTRSRSVVDFAQHKHLSERRKASVAWSLASPLLRASSGRGSFCA
jgi:hypothetical protein